MKLNALAALVAALAIAELPLAGLSGVAQAVALCPQDLHGFDIDRAYASAAEDGARAEWILRTLEAPDYADGGHSNTTVWLGTDGNIKESWVEVGVTQGFGLANLYTYYVAHQNASGYADYRLGGLNPTLGDLPQFTVRFTTSNVRAEVYEGRTTVGINVSGHSYPVDYWDIGAEFTCYTGSNQSRVNKHYVVTNQWRRKSDGVWLNASLGDRHEDPPLLSGGIEWCDTYRTFRYWYRSSTPTGYCT